MPYNIEPFMDDLDEANAILEEHGIYGATKKPCDGTLRLYARRRKWTDPETGEVIYYYPDRQMTPEIEARLKALYWRVDKYLTSQWAAVWQG